ncbi:MAG TPA: lipase family protein, partial [Bacteroidia bacterium]|nr:lipase family protein [Bacteroidia bacterium]
EVPISIQTLSDIERGNPFANINVVMGGAKGSTRMIAKHVVRKMNRSVKKARKRFTKYLGKRSGFFVRKKLETFPKQQYVASLNYMTCGVPIILPADAAYHKKYPDDVKNVFRHHGFAPYLYLLNQYYPVK